MNLFHVDLVANVVSNFSGMAGRYLRILSGDDDVNFEVRYTNGTIRSQIIPGIGIDLSHPETGEPFKDISFKSEVTQRIRVLISYFPSTDSRLAGDVDVNGVLSVVNAGGLIVENSKLALVAGVPKLVMAADVARLKGSLYFDVAVSIGKTNAVTVADGYPLTAGSDWVHENVAELWAVSSANGTVWIIEDKK